MKTEEFCLSLKKHGVNFVTGVPCASLKKIINYFFEDPEIIFIQATREDEAVGIATGAYFSGRKPLVFMQNSGLANSINALASLCISYQIPILFLVTWRGCPDDKKEPPYHCVMGKSTIPMMNLMGISVQVISKENPELGIATSIAEMEKKKIPAVMLLGRKEILE